VVFRRDGVESVVLPISDIALKGDHNIENILSATCGAMLADVAVSDVAEALRHFEGVTDRQEMVREVDEITYINDTAATGPDAVTAALKRFATDGKQDVVLIAGGVNKKLAYAALAEDIVKACKAVFVFPGDASDLIVAAINNRVPVTMVQNMKEAVQGAHAAAVRGDTVLLSPGAASFNLFRNEFERGEQFREEVRNL
jgi:UDP-N-acetylmuramoylalanine--D-glutamate ligase